MPNAIDLTTTAAVKSWATVQSAGDDSIIQDAITAFSLHVLHLTGRGNADGSVPTASPFNAPVSYDEFYDGNGNDRLPLRNWPITAVASVNDSGIVIPQSQSLNSPGWVVDQSGKFIVLRYGGYLNNYRGHRGPQFSRCGFTLGTQNVEVQYTAGFSATPFDLELMARRVVALNYKSRQAIGQRSQAMAQGAGTVSWDWSLSDEDKAVIAFYQRRVA